MATKRTGGSTTETPQEKSRLDSIVKEMKKNPEMVESAMEIWEHGGGPPFGEEMPGIRGLASLIMVPLSDEEQKT